MADWQPGDLALCVRRGLVICPTNGHSRHRGGFVRGAALKEVASILRTPLDNGLFCGCVTLTFADGSSGIEYRFVKVTPPEADAFDRETIALENGVPEFERARRHLASLSRERRDQLQREWANPPPEQNNPSNVEN